MSTAYKRSYPQYKIKIMFFNYWLFSLTIVPDQPSGLAIRTLKTKTLQTDKLH